MGLFRRKSNEPSEPSAGDTQLERMKHARIPVFLSKYHSEYPPRWVTAHGDRLESVTGAESPEYMDDASNHEVWSVGHFVDEFPWIEKFLNEARPGQTALFSDRSGDYVLDD